MSLGPSTLFSIKAFCLWSPVSPVVPCRVPEPREVLVSEMRLIAEGGTTAPRASCSGSPCGAFVSPGTRNREGITYLSPNHWPMADDVARG
eukprot:5075665-Prymnesium_polylepis.1